MKKTTAEMNETMVEPRQVRVTAAPTAAKARPRIHGANARLEFHAQTERLTTYAVALAQAMGLPADAVSRIGAAAALHDIGRITPPARRPAGRSSRQKSAAEDTLRHPQMAADLIRNLHGFAACVPAILYHHECYDGSGYPAGLKGDKAPLEARVLAVADWFANATTDQPNKPALSTKEAIAHLQENSGTRFDPGIVAAFVDVINSGIVKASREDPARPRRRVNR